MKHTILLVDFENVKELNLTVLPSTCHVRIFVGKLQNSIPFALTRDAQRFGDRLEWVKIAGDGKNNLDFHLAYYLGRLAQASPDANFLILSKDKGFDSLISHLGHERIACRRISRLDEFSPAQDSTVNDPHFKRAFEVLAKIEKKSRPRKRNTLMQHVSAIFQKTLPPEEVQRVVAVFFTKKLITESKNVLSYEF